MDGPEDSRQLAVIDLIGCDDTTRIGMSVTAAELAFLHRLAEESRKASSYSCQPVMAVLPASDENGR
ncbi:MAG TPA: hypothetical protein VFF89_00510 [Sphingobium sp.]|nr:hypothetical protein [Sphingobium sp.]